MGRGPVSSNELRRKQLRTPYVHVPTVDWAAVRIGQKREFRCHPNYGAMPHAKNVAFLPITVVAWCQTKAGIRHEELMILEDAWVEPLRAISPEGIAAEGFETRADFKRYWIKRHPRGGWRGMSTVIVIRIRPMDEDDRQQQQTALFRYLYGLWLPEE